MHINGKINTCRTKSVKVNKVYNRNCTHLTDMLPLSLRLIAEKKNTGISYKKILKKIDAFLNHHLLTSVLSEGARTKIRNELFHMKVLGLPCLMNVLSFIEQEENENVPLCEKSKTDAEKLQKQLLFRQC